MVQLLKKLLVFLLFIPVVASAQLTVPQGGTGKTTFTSGQVIYMGGGTLRMQSTPTTTVSCLGSVACSSFTVFGSSPYTITGSGGAHDEWTHPGPGQSATTSYLFFNGGFFAPNSTTTNATTTGSQYFSFLTPAAGSFLAVDPTGKLIATTTSDFESPLTFNSPLSRTGNAISFLFNTINTWTAQNYFSSLFATNATTTNATTTGSQYFSYITNAAGSFLATDPTGKVIGTTTPSSGSGTVTNIATTFPIQGGPITTTGTITFGGLATTSPWTGGQVTYVSSNNLIASAATTSITAGTGVSFTGTAGALVGGSNLTINATGGGAKGQSWEIVSGFLAPTTSIPIAVAGNSTSTFNNGIAAGTIVGAPFFNATSTTATSTFNGNGYFKGNLQVDGNFFAPVQIVSSGNATINGNLNVTGATTLASSLTGLLYGTSGLVSSITNGTAGSVLAMSGGLPTWVATSSITGFWTGSGNNIYNNNSANVGIGTTTPGSLLSVGDTEGINFRTATSTFNTTGGIDLKSGGCFAINGTCVGSGSSLTGTTGQVAYFSGTNTAIGTSSIFIATSGKVGIASTTPFGGLSVASGSTIVNGENNVATSTSITISWLNGTQQLVRMGASATTINFSNYIDGQILRVILCNPRTTSGSITWDSAVLWTGGAAPTKTTAANKCDIYSFIATQGTTTLRIFGGSVANF